MQKNVANQKVIVYAYNRLTGDREIGDHGNFYAMVSKDGATAVSSGGTFSEVGVGYSSYTPTQAETNCDVFVLHVTSTTTNIEVEDVIIYTNTNVATKSSIDDILWIHLPIHKGVIDSINTDTTLLTSSTFADGKSLAEAIQIIASAVAGRVSGAGTGTETFLGMDESTTRITVTVDSDGNRSDITYG